MARFRLVTGMFFVVCCYCDYIEYVYFSDLLNLTIKSGTLSLSESPIIIGADGSIGMMLFNNIEETFMSLTL